MSRYDEDPTDRRDLRSHGWNLAGELQARIQRTASSPEEASALVEGAVNRLRDFEEGMHEAVRHGGRYPRKPAAEIRKASTIAREFAAERSASRREPKPKPYFGYEKTRAQWLQRIQWEQQMADRAIERGDDIIAQAHLRVAQDYKDLLDEKFPLGARGSRRR